MVRARIAEKSDVGKDNVAIGLTTPSAFDAYPGQFVQIRAEIHGEEISRYYTISSPTVAETFEITVEVDPEGTLSPWLRERPVGESVAVDGPFGDIRYSGERDVAILASGPGIGPAVGIAERAHMEGSRASVIHDEETPIHRRRLETLERNGGTVSYAPDDDALVTSVTEATPDAVFVFGFERFVSNARSALSTADVDVPVAVESFGPQ